VSRLGPGAEFDLIRRLLDGASGHHPGVRVGPGDDAAIVIGENIAISTDMVVEDVHFRRSWLAPNEIGYHATAAALSDLAAMAARPIGVLASVAIGPGDETDFASDLMAGVIEAADAEAAILIGGDVTRSPGPLVLDIVVVGDARAPVLRSGAAAGDDVWVTGSLGAAAAAVTAWLQGREPPAAARAAFARPRPRTREALWLVERQLPTAMIDVSDGIAGDAAHLGAASGVRIVLQAAAVPVARESELALAVAGGQDYELCFTAAPGAVQRVAGEFSSRFGVPLTLVGSVEAGAGKAAGAVVVDATGEPMDLVAFQHWGRA